MRSIGIIFFCLLLFFENVSSADKKKVSKKSDMNYFLKKPYLRLSPFEITIFENNTCYGTMRISVILKTTPNDWADIRLKVPSLYHHMFVDLYQSLNYLWDRTNTPDYKILTKRLQAVADKILGPGKIESITIGLIYLSKTNE